MSENFAEYESEEICFYPAVGMMCVSGGGLFILQKMKISKMINDEEKSCVYGEYRQLKKKLPKFYCAL